VTKEKKKVKLLHIPTGIVFEVPNYLSFWGLFAKSIRESDYHRWEKEWDQKPKKAPVKYVRFCCVRSTVEIIHYAGITPNDRNEYSGTLEQLRSENTIDCFEILYD
jgi:hypothetical protein